MKKIIYIIVAISVILIATGLYLNFLPEKITYSNEQKIENMKSLTSYKTVFTIKNTDSDIFASNIRIKNNMAKIDISSKNEAINDTYLINYDDMQYKKFNDSNYSDFTDDMKILDILDFINNEQVISSSVSNYDIANWFLFSNLNILNRNIECLNDIELSSDNLATAKLTFNNKYVTEIEFTTSDMAFNYKFSAFDQLNDNSF